MVVFLDVCFVLLGGQRGGWFCFSLGRVVDRCGWEGRWGEGLFDDDPSHPIATPTCPPPLFALREGGQWNPTKKTWGIQWLLWVTLLVGIEMSFFRYRDFSIFFSVSRSSLTSNFQDVEAQKSTDRLIPRRGRYRCWTTEYRISIPKKRSRYQKGDLGHLDTTKKTSRYQKKTHPISLVFLIRIGNRCINIISLLFARSKNAPGMGNVTLLTFSGMGNVNSVESHLGANPLHSGKHNNVNNVNQMRENLGKSQMNLTLLTFPLRKTKMLLAGKMRIMLTVLNPYFGKKELLSGKKNTNLLK